VRKTEKRELAAFTAIETSGAFEVTVTCQKTASFEIEADDNILPLVESEATRLHSAPHDDQGLAEQHWRNARVHQTGQADAEWLH
jgi:hypothetical protein